ncbi:autophagy-related protein 23-like isoform X2 [Colias croceus]|nr:autophagy-related protein 23-like isoform X2 [Colias croceus]XP_045497632.1 autophagy-related protein 23-like isoform X2 [Colias croceus]
MDEAKIPPERLYLWKEKENDVFIEHNNIYDHQTDGLRFLFKQFKKKNPGVILNYPRRCGKSVTIVLFLYAIRKLLQQPVLILCKDTQDAENWHQCFQMWSGFSPDEIAFEPTKALLKKQIFIKSMSDLVSFTRRSWSILVHKDDDFEGLPQFSSVDFYIWATSTDVMKDLPFLSSIYKWINPKEKINFDHDKGDFKKQILLDAQLENIVLRRFRISMPDQQTNNDEDYCIQPKKSKKNKDATGKKIKRSKVVSKDINVNQPGSSNQEKKHDTNDDAKMDIETFINDKNPVAKDQDEFDDKFADLQYDSNDSFIYKETKVLNDDTENIDKTDAIASVTEDNLPSDVNTEIILENSVRESLSDTNDTSDCVLKYSDNTDIHDNTKSDVSLNETSDNINNLSDSILKPDSADVTTNSEMKVQKISNGVKNNDNANDSLIKDLKENEDTDKKIKPNVSHKTDIDSKINEMEEKAMKKFKGSILDSIFN